MFIPRLHPFTRLIHKYHILDKFSSLDYLNKQFNTTNINSLLCRLYIMNLNGKVRNAKMEFDVKGTSCKKIYRSKLNITTSMYPLHQIGRIP